MTMTEKQVAHRLLLNGNVSSDNKKDEGKGLVSK